MEGRRERAAWCVWRRARVRERAKEESYACDAWDCPGSMSLAVTQSKETEDAELQRVIEYRVGWLKMDFEHRGKDLEKLNLVQYVDKIGMPVPVDPSEPPLVNYRYYFDMPKFAEIRAAAEKDASVDQQITAEMQAMAAGCDVPTHFLEQYQLKECAHCGKRDGKLSLCNGCRSFVYCCSEHQVADWKAKHKFVCLKRKQWAAVEEISRSS